MNISLHGLREIRGHKVLMVWMIVSEILAITLRVTPGACEIGEAAYRSISIFVPSVRNVDVSAIWGMQEAKWHYAIMWSVLPFIVVSLVIDKTDSWKKFMYKNGAPPTAGGWAIIFVCAILFYLFPVWEAGLLRYLVISIWTFSIVSCFIVYAIAIVIRAVIFKSLNF